MDQGTHSQDSLYGLESLVYKDTKPGGYAWLVTFYTCMMSRQFRVLKVPSPKQPNVEVTILQNNTCLVNIHLLVVLEIRF